MNPYASLKLSELADKKDVGDDLSGIGWKAIGDPALAEVRASGLWGVCTLSCKRQTPTTLLVLRCHVDNYNGVNFV